MSEKDNLTEAIMKVAAQRNEYLQQSYEVVGRNEMLRQLGPIDGVAMSVMFENVMSEQKQIQEKYKKEKIEKQRIQDSETKALPHNRLEDVE